MGVDIAHLIFEAFRNADDQIIDDGLHCPECGDVLAGAMV